jgi:hypothetical protein
MPITGVGGLKGDKGDTGAAGAPGTTDYTALTNKPTLGTAAATASTDYATSAQGAKADTAVQPATLTTGLATKADSIHVHSQADVSSLVSDLAAKQATLVSGTNIKTINGSSLLGSGDLAIAGGGGSGTVTSVTSATTDATVATTTTTPVITIVSAPKLTTARTINGTSFDGTANITVADSTKEPTIAAGTTAQYYRGDKTFQTLDKTAVGLANVDNTSDATKNSATATLTNKSLQDSTTFIVDDVDATKKLNFQASAQTTGTTNVITFPNGTSMTVVGTGATQTLTAKTLTNPLFTAGTTTVPAFRFGAGVLLTTALANAIEYDGTDFYYSTSAAVRRTIVNLDATQTLSNKTLSSPSLTGTTTAAALNVTNTNGTLSFSSTTDGADFNIFHTATGTKTLAFYGSASNTMNVAILDGTLTVQGQNVVTATTGAPKITVATAAPGSPATGDIWIDTN